MHYWTQYSSIFFLFLSVQWVTPPYPTLPWSGGKMTMNSTMTSNFWSKSASDGGKLECFSPWNQPLLTSIETGPRTTLKVANTSSASGSEVMGTRNTPWPGWGCTRFLSIWEGVQQQKSCMMCWRVQAQNTWTLYVQYCSEFTIPILLYIVPGASYYILTGCSNLSILSNVALSCCDSWPANPTDWVLLRVLLSDVRYQVSL